MSSHEPTDDPSPAENCARIKKLGYIAGKHVDLYGEHMELISDPFEDGDRIGVRAISGSDPSERTIDLPMTLLTGWEDLFEGPADPAASELPAEAPLPEPAEQKSE